MSTPARGRGGGGLSRGSGGPSPRGRGGGRGNTNILARGRGRGRGGSSTTPADASATGLLQKLRNGNLQQGDEAVATATTRGRGTGTRGQLSSVRRGRGSSATSAKPSAKPVAMPGFGSPNAKTSAPSYRDFMAQMTDKFQVLKPKRDAERKKAIQDGFLADPDKKTSLANAITPVGTCTEMCPEFERVERIVQNMVDRAEKVPNESSGRDMPSEERMIKRFRRSAAGYDEQLPSDIRTPETLQRTLDYLLDHVIGGGERLASIHKFVWDRTRGIRNDFSIQQVTKPQDVQIAVDCYERIARFHILSLHQLSNPDNLMEGEHFDAHQEREQLNNTLLSLMYYYDDNRNSVPLQNEAEFRAYCILFELQALTPDLEERMQSWPQSLLKHPRVQTAFKIYAAAGNTVFDQGPLRPLMPFSVAQANAGTFWTIMSSLQVSYLMSCVAEMNFAMVRFTALDALWRSGKSAPQGQQQKNQEWTLGDLTDHLGFDDEEQTTEFVGEFNLAFGRSQSGDQYLDFTATSATSLDRSLIPSQQLFSHEIVERKRYSRTLVAVINGINVATAMRNRLVVETAPSTEVDNISPTNDDEQTIFVPDSTGAQQPSKSIFSTNLNPEASAFSPGGFGFPTSTSQPKESFFSTKFGETVSKSAQISGFGTSATGFIGFNQPVTTGIGSVSGPTTSNPTPTLFQSFTKPQLESKAPEQGTSQTDKPSFVSSQTPVVSVPVAQSAVHNNTLFTPNAFNSGPAAQSSIQQAPNIFRESQKHTNTAVPAIVASTLPGPKSLEPPEPAPSTSQVISTQQSPLPVFTFTSANSQPLTSKPVTVSSVFTSTTAQPLQPAEAATKPDQKPIFQFTPTAPATTPPQSTSLTSSIFPPQPTVQTRSAAPPETSKPLFDFAKAQIPITSTLQAAPATNPSIFAELTTSTTTPAGSPKRPSLGDTKFQSVSSNSVFQAPASFIPSAPEPSRSPTSNSIDSSKLLVEPPQPDFLAAARTALIHNTAHIALVQPQGLMEYFIGNHVSDLLHVLVKEYQEDVHKTIIEYVKTKYLARKFYARWRAITKKAVLNRRAQQRRRLLAAAMQADIDRKKRHEQELEAIIIATQQTKRLQEEARNRAKDAAIVKSAQMKPQAVKLQTSQVAGIKRKESTSFGSGQSSFMSTSGQHNTHKRSRTMSSSSGTVATRKLSTSVSSFGALSASARFTQSFFGLPASSQQFRSSLPTHKVDATKTDYFKLKAMGIDPNTPLIPDTAKTLAERQQRHEAERQALVSSIRYRARSISRTTNTVLGSSMSPPVTSPKVAEDLSQEDSTSIPTSMAKDDDDEFLSMLREARKEMSQDAEWFRNATATLETEIQQQESFRQSQRSQSSASTVPTTENGLSRANGYEFFPMESTGRRSLSRTERRIRATGAHGLATKPVGSRGVYTPSPVTKSSPSQVGATVQHDQLSRDSPHVSRKRGFSDLNVSRSSGGRLGGNEHGDHASHEEKRFRGAESSKHRLQSVNNHTTTFTAPVPSNNMFASLIDEDSYNDDDEQEGKENDRTREGSRRSRLNKDYQSQNNLEAEENGTDEAEEIEDEDDDDDGDEDAEDGDDESYIYDRRLMPDEELVEEDEDDEEEGDEFEEEEEEEDEDDNDGGYMPANSTFAYPAISQGSSRHTSTSANFDQTTGAGAGASADDALVLSD